MSAKFWIIAGSVLAAIAVGAGALGAHALRPRLDSRAFESFETAVRYQMFHALAIVVVGLLVTSLPNAWWNIAGWLFLAGSVLFAGGIYAWIATGERTFVHFTPLGGVCLIAGWVALAIIAIMQS